MAQDNQIIHILDNRIFWHYQKDKTSFVEA